MVKPNTSEEVNPLYPMTPIPSHASGDDFMCGLTIRNPFSSKQSLGVELSELG